jgi:hypothetical protein
MSKRRVEIDSQPAIKPENDGRYLLALRKLYLTDVTDVAAGGVPPSAAATYLSHANSTARRRLKRLCDLGLAVRVHGINPETMRPRPSYASIDAPDVSLLSSAPDTPARRPQGVESE